MPFKSVMVVVAGFSRRRVISYRRMGWILGLKNNFSPGEKIKIQNVEYYIFLSRRTSPRGGILPWFWPPSVKSAKSHREKVVQFCDHLGVA